jgi:hypothetical protein
MTNRLFCLPDHLVEDRNSQRFYRKLGEKQGKGRAAPVQGGLLRAMTCRDPGYNSPHSGYAEAWAADEWH